MTRRYGGVGLGLSLARDLARAMGGGVEAEGAVGVGACFTFTVPLAKAEAPIARSAPADVGEDAGEDDPPVRILLAEDNPANRTVVELILGAAGVELVSVENGAEAVDAFAAQRFDLVLMDLQMPVMDGLTAIRLIREREQGGARTPIIVLSANVQAEHVEGSAAAGADMHLAKPIVAATLLAALEQALTPPEDAAAA
jgi:CheY-like chemotaxis protein